MWYIKDILTGKYLGWNDGYFLTLNPKSAISFSDFERAVMCKNVDLKPLHKAKLNLLVVYLRRQNLSGKPVLTINNDFNTCYYCGAKEECTKEHFIPRHRHGRIIVPGCAVCQRTKGGKMPDEWLFYLIQHGGFTDEHIQKVTAAIRTLQALMKEQDEEVKIEIPTHT